MSHDASAANDHTAEAAAPVGRVVAGVLVLGAPIVPAAAWILQVPGIVTGPIAVALGSALAVAMGRTLWPARGRWFALVLSLVTLAAMVVAAVAAADLSWLLPVGATQESYTLGLWVPMCAPQGFAGFAYPALAAVGVYAVGAVGVVRWPLLWPLVGAAGVVAFQVGGNIAQGAGAAWIC